MFVRLRGRRLAAVHTAAAVLVLAAGPPAHVPAAARTAAPDPSPPAATPLQPVRAIRLVPLWSVGGEDSAVLFGRVVAVAVDDGGDLLVLDGQLGRVEAFSPEGDHLGTIIRPGEGPGEVRMPVAMTVLADGSVAVLDRFPARLVRVRSDGTPLATVDVEAVRAPGSGHLVGQALAAAGEDLVVAAAHNADGMRTSVKLLARFAPDGHELVRLREVRAPIDRERPTCTDHDFLNPFAGTWCVDRQGRAWFPPDPFRYAIDVIGADGRTGMVAAREYRSRERTERERLRVSSLIDAHLAGLRDRTEVSIDDREPAVADLQCGPDGVIWVEHGHSRYRQPAGVLLTCDTFDAEGRWLQEVVVLADGDPEFDSVRLLGDGRAIVIRNHRFNRWADQAWHPVRIGEEAPAGAMEIVCCRAESAPLPDGLPATGR